MRRGRVGNSGDYSEMMEGMMMEGLEISEEESGSRTSFLHLTEDKGDTSPLPDSSYKVQLEHLEDRLREFAALIKARDKELSSLYQDPSFSPGPTLEDESPHQTKTATLLRNEADRLKSEIRSVNRSIATYEQKLSDINSRLCALESQHNSSFFLRDNDKLTDLTKKISLFQHANGDLQEQVEATKSALLAVQRDSDGMKTLLIPALQAHRAAFEGQRNRVKTGVEEARREVRAASRCSLTPGLTIKPIQLRAKTGKGEKTSQKSSPRMTPALIRETPTPRCSSPRYIPSFLRCRKAALLSKKRVK